MSPNRTRVAGYAIVAWALAARAEASEELAARARDGITDVLGRPEFQPLRDADVIPTPDLYVPDHWLGRVGEFFADVARWVGDHVLEPIGDIIKQMFRGLGGFFGGGAGAAGTAAAVSPLVYWTVGVLVVALLVWLVIRMSNARRSERRAAGLAMSVAASDDEGADDALARTPEDWRRQAESLAHGGEFGQALRALYLELLSGLHRAGAIDYDRTRTNTAYVRDVPITHSAHAPFTKLTLRFDRAVYGHHEPDAAIYAVAVGEVAEVKASYVPERSRAR